MMVLRLSAEAEQLLDRFNDVVAMMMNLNIMIF